MRDTTRSFLKLELLICFLPCTCMLFIGAVMLTNELVRGAQGRSTSEGVGAFFLVVSCGAIGLWTLLRVVLALFDGREIIEKPDRILIGVLLGAAPLVYQIFLALSSEGEVRWGIFTATVVLPLLSSAHVVYLGRRLLTASFQRSKP